MGYDFKRWLSPVGFYTGQAKWFNAAKTYSTIFNLDSSALSADATLTLKPLATTSSVFLPATGTLATLAGSEALSNKTYNALSLTAASIGFTVAGGTTSKTLTVSNTLTLSGTDASTLNIGGGGTLGTAAFVNTGTSGATIPLLNAANLWAGTQTFTAPVIGAATGTSLAVSGALTSSSPSAGIGYATGAGGSVTQQTSKSTGVSLDSICGRIITSNSTLNSGQKVVFTVTNASVAATDNINIHIVSGPASDESYDVQICAVAAGSFKVRIWNIYGDAISLSEAITLSFFVKKSVIS